jgi:hypothetical protein
MFGVLVRFTPENGDGFSALCKRTDDEPLSFVSLTDAEEKVKEYNTDSTKARYSVVRIEPNGDWTELFD